MRYYRFGHELTWLYTKVKDGDEDRGGDFATNLYRALGKSWSNHKFLLVYEGKRLIAQADVSRELLEIGKLYKPRSPFHHDDHYYSYCYVDDMKNETTAHNFLACRLLPRLGLEP